MKKSRRVALTEAAQAAVKKEIAALVERYLEPHQPRRYRLNVIAVQPDGDYFYVVVRPDRDDYSDYDYYARLAETTRDIDEHENINLLLVPTGPG